MPKKAMEAEGCGEMQMGGRGFLGVRLPFFKGKKKNNKKKRGWGRKKEVFSRQNKDKTVLESN